MEQCFPDSVFKIILVSTFNKVRKDFRIRFGTEGVPFRLQRLLQRQIILNDSVMNQENLT